MQTIYALLKTTIKSTVQLIDLFKKNSEKKHNLSIRKLQKASKEPTQLN